MGRLLSNVLGFISLFSPPFLLGFTWKRFFEPHESQSQPKWRTILAWLALLSVSSPMAACIGAFVTNHCNTDQGDWSCVVRWESFTRFVLRSTPVLIVLGFLGRKGTQIFAVLSVLAMAFDCVLIDMTR